MPAPIGFDSTVGEQHEPAVFRQAIQTLYCHGPKVFAANVVNAVVVTAVLWSQVDRDILLVWLAATATLGVARAGLARGFDPNGPPRRVRQWARRFTIGAALSGVLWGAGAFVMFTPGDPAPQVLLAFTIGGMSAGASSSTASHLPAFYAFLVPAIAPLIARFASGGDAFQWGMATMLGLFAVLVTMIGRTNNRTMTESHRLSFVNDVLVARLCDAHGDLEASNTALELRVKERTQQLERQTTARHTAERQLARGQKLEAVGRLTGGVAHDFNNLLTVIVSALDELEHSPNLDRRGEVLDHARQAALRGGSLTRSLLAFSRRKPVVREVVDPADLLRRMTTSMIRRALPASVELTVQVPDKPLRIEVDGTQLETALLNLVLNARDAMPRGGPLHIELHSIVLGEDAEIPAGRYVEFRVCDRGEGMAPAVVDRVFDPFFTTKGDGGTGLGLSMVYGFAEQSGGEVRIESVQGSGTSVRLLLPQIASDAPLAPSPETGTIRRGREETVLEVEDDESVRHLTAMSVRGLGYLAIEASTAVEALNKLGSHPEIALVMSDIVMPGGMDGVSLAHEIHRLHPGLPVVLASGYSEGTPDISGVPRLAKPYRRAALAESLHRALHAS
ncbi:MAG: response regulator [Nannocystaceae bacterium]|nr:response regulator [Nannocystaceae bacterium]